MRRLKNSLIGKDHHELTARMLLLIALVYVSYIGGGWGGIAFPFLFLALGGFLLYAKSLKSPIIWGSLAAILLIRIVEDFYWAANHHFLLMFACVLLAVAGSLPSDRSEGYLRLGSRYLIIVLLFFVTLQKIFSPLFMSGEYFSHMLMRGQLFIPIPVIIGDYATWVAYSREIFIEAAAAAPGSTAACQSISPPYPELFRWAGWGLSMLVLLLEGGAFLIFTFSKRPGWRNAALIALIVGVLLARPECGFLSVLAALGFAQCPNEMRGAKLTFLFLVTLFTTLVTLELAFP